MTDLVVHSMMQLLVLVVLLAGPLVDAHDVLLQPLTPVHYVVDAGLVSSPQYTYWVNHGAAASPRGAVSRETLEEQSGEDIQRELDISEEQAHLDPDEAQVPDRRPLFPSFPSPNVPAVPQYPLPSLPPANRPAIRPGTAPSPGDPGIVFEGPHPDGSYHFSYSQDDQSRSEKGDAQGSVQGSYSYTGPDGKVVTITYTAGSGTGYVPVGEGLLPPPQPSGPGGDDGQNPDGDDSQGYVPPADDSQNNLPPDDNQQPAIPDGDGQQEEGGYKPYSYNYDAHTSRKSETADDQGNVKGSYWYIDGAGAKRTVTYTVNGEEGFIANEAVAPGAAPPDNAGAQRPVNPHTAGGGTKGGNIPLVPTIPPRPHVLPPLVPAIPPRPLVPPTKGGKAPLAPPAKGVKGGRGWAKYPLGK